MTHTPIIAIDTLGGDHGLSVTLAGAALAHKRWPSLKFCLYGRAEELQSEMRQFPNLTLCSEVVDTREAVTGDEAAAHAIKRYKVTSMGQSILAVREGHADAAISAGNTGALMGMAKIILGTLPGIERPAIAAMLPSLGDNGFCMLDLGANTTCSAQNLQQFAVMGAAYAQAGLELAHPRVALLNIGSEDLKGRDEIREAAAVLRNTPNLPFSFHGFIEGDKLTHGKVDVVVCDGFSGNIALKTLEGTARFISDLLRRAFTSSLRSKLGFLISKPATALVSHHLDPNNYNGGIMLGLNGIVVKSHGSANINGFANAIGVAKRLVENKMIAKISHNLKNME